MAGARAGAKRGCGEWKGGERERPLETTTLPLSLRRWSLAPPNGRQSGARRTARTIGALYARVLWLRGHHWEPGRRGRAGGASFGVRRGRERERGRALPPLLSLPPSVPSPADFAAAGLLASSRPITRRSVPTVRTSPVIARRPSAGEKLLGSCRSSERGGGRFEGGDGGGKSFDDARRVISRWAVRWCWFQAD